MAGRSKPIGLVDVGEQLVINFNVDYRQGVLRMSDLLITGVL